MEISKDDNSELIDNLKTIPPELLLMSKEELHKKLEQLSSDVTFDSNGM